MAGITNIGGGIIKLGKMSYLLYRRETVCANTKIRISEKDFIESPRESLIVTADKSYIRNVPILMTRGQRSGPIVIGKARYMSGYRSIKKRKGLDNFRYSNNTKYRYSPIASNSMIFSKSIDIRRTSE